MGMPKVAEKGCYLILNEVKLVRPVTDQCAFLVREIADPPLVRISQGYVGDGQWFCWV